MESLKGFDGGPGRVVVEVRLVQDGVDTAYGCDTTRCASL